VVVLGPLCCSNITAQEIDICAKLPLGRRIGQKCKLVHADHLRAITGMNGMKVPLIYLANLTHYRDGIASTEAIPLNIGYLATYLRANLGHEVRIELFNLPHKLDEAIQKEAPDILATSAYIWSFRLNYAFLENIKVRLPHTVTVMGGPNFPGAAEYREQFMRHYSGIDFFCFLEGESSFLKLVQSLLADQFDINAVKRQKLAGFNYLLNGEFFDGGAGARIRNLDVIPSPYLSGDLDGMLSEGFVPMLQTNRGCPFTCTFCCSGNDYHAKVDRFDLGVVLNEIDYIAGRVKAKSLHITDDNFGIFPRDKDISKKLAEYKRTHEWPLIVNVSTSKVNKKQVAECIAVLEDSIEFSASMQSFNDETLMEIRRKNLSFGEFSEIIGKLRERRVQSSCEIILGMPKETANSHLSGIRQAVEAGIDNVAAYTAMLLWNTPMKEDPGHARFQMVRRFRVIPRDFGIYQGRKVVEVEEVSVGTATLSIGEYYNLRGFHFVLSNYYNLGIFKELVGYLRQCGLSVFDWLTGIQDWLIMHPDTEVGKIYHTFLKDSRDELWETEEELLEYYRLDKNFGKLLDGQAGANLIFKFQAVALDHVDAFAEVARIILLRNDGDISARVVSDILRHCTLLRGSIFDLSKETKYHSMCFDILAWIKSGMATIPAEDGTQVDLEYVVRVRQQEILREYLEFYGASENARGRILTRISAELLYRACDYSCNLQAVAAS